MKIIIIHETEDGQQIDQFDNIRMFDYEDQEYLNNGRWLHIYPRGKEEFAVAIEENDWFRILPK